MSSSDRKQDLGDLFSQRRSAAAAKQKQQQSQSQQPSEGQSSSNSRASSLLDIQAEQERERHHPRDNHHSHSSSGGGGGGGGRQRGGAGDEPERRNRNSRSPNRRSYESQQGGSNNNNSSIHASSNNNNNNNNSGGQRRMNAGRGGRPPNRGSYDHLPLEQGVICSLKESFGFIRCADRPEEIFFHYSELVGCRSDELNMEEEVEFRVQVRGDDKLAALQVRVLEKGTIVWETEEEPGVRHQGVVERPARTDTRGFAASNSDGTIRILVAAAVDPNHSNAEEEATVINAVLSADAPSIRFRNNDYQPAVVEEQEKTQDFRSSGGGSSAGAVLRLSKGDIVEFSVVTDRRTKNKYARGIMLLQSERERARKAREEELLASATVEQGVVTSLKSDYGFLRSNRRREQVYFHYSNVLMPEQSEDFILKEGQDMSFLVVVESNGEDGQKRRVSARGVELLPRGSVVFANMLAMGVTGVVTRCPHPVDSGHNDEVAGMIQLTEPLHDKDEDGADVVVSQVLLSPKDSPGGDFSYRSGAAVGVWIREGDTLLFDVTKDIADGTYRASPTKCLEPLASLTEEGNDDVVKEDEPKLPPAVRLVNLSLVSRAEGVVHAIKDNYGFIHYAERIVDVHFRLYEMLPDELQADLQRNLGYTSPGKKPLRLEVGSEVQFDLSLHGKVSAPSARGGRNAKSPQERENLKAQRLLLVPAGTVKHDKILAIGVKGDVTKEDPKQPHAGTIDLDQEIQLMTMAERYPLVAKMIETFLDNSQPALIYPDLMSLKESDVVIEMAQTMGKGKLECIFIPFAADLSHPGRLCIRKISPPDADANVKDTAEGDKKGPTIDDDTHASDEGVSETNAGRGKSTPSRKKGHNNKIQIVKTVRYDKHSLAEKFKDVMPPSEGDIVICDVVQSRKTGQVSLANVSIIERKSGEELDAAAVPKKNGNLGIVKEIAQSRQYGFISVFDENSSKAELLFFHMNDIVQESDGENCTASTRKQVTLHKGDEVKFDYGREKNGKKVAKNVEVVPKGTVPIKVEKSACSGYVVMVPSRTTIANSPPRHSGSNSSAASGSRWDNVKVDSKSASTTTTELGSILLIEDPEKVFATNVASSNKKDDGVTTTDVSVSQSSNGAMGEDGTVPEKENAKPEHTTSPVFRVSYTNSVVAHGPGPEGSITPRRGDLVSFLKAKSGGGVRDVRVVKSAAATFVKGRLEDIVLPQSGSDRHGIAKFIVGDGDTSECYPVDLTEVVSCNASALKEKEPVEGILHDGKIYGVCRISDIHLESKLGSSHKERPKLNLTVRKDRGGTIMAQSMMAKVS